MAQDVLIIGCGLAGLTAALALPSHLRITLLSKDGAENCASAWAQGGIAAVMDPQDSIEAHVQDTLVAGAHQCDENAVRVILEQAPDAIAWLQAHGVRFDALDDHARTLHLTREGGHSHRRIVHVADKTGEAVHGTLLSTCRQRSNIRILSGHAALDLLTDDGAPCTGARVQTPRGDIIAMHARHTVLATGGLGQLFSHTTNPPAATGDGIAMAWRAGCSVQDLEFIQFHPTALHINGQAQGLITEALRGEGATLHLPNGERFMPRHDTRAELAPRDIVARAIWSEMRRHGLQHVWLDISHQSRAWLEQHFPGVMQLCAQHGLDIATEPIPVAPCAHYACGGIRAGIDGQTELAGLHAIGEVARTGLHGANRLASNSLLECVVMGRAAACTITQAHGLHDDQMGSRHGIVAMRLPGARANERNNRNMRGEATQRELQQLMSRSAGILRNTLQLTLAARQLSQWHAGTHDAALRNQLDVCALIVQAALSREQSCGSHALEELPT